MSASRSIVFVAEYTDGVHVLSERMHVSVRRAAKGGRGSMVEVGYMLAVQNGFDAFAVVDCDG